MTTTRRNDDEQFDYGEDGAHDNDRNDDDQKSLMTMMKLKRSIIMIMTTVMVFTITLMITTICRRVDDRHKIEGEMK